MSAAAVARLEADLLAAEAACDPHGPRHCAADRHPLEGTGDGYDAALFHADEHHGGHLCTVLGHSCDRHCPGRLHRRRSR